MNTMSPHNLVILLLWGVALTSADYHEVPIHFLQEHTHHVVVGPDGVPHDTPEVALARAEHEIAHAEVKARKENPHAHVGGVGVPEETPEVAEARQKHFIAHAIAVARIKAHREEKEQRQQLAIEIPQTHHLEEVAHYERAEEEPHDHHVEEFLDNHLVVMPHFSLNQIRKRAIRRKRDLHHFQLAEEGVHEFFHQHHHVPVIDERGVPVDTPEVQKARAMHLAAHEEAKHGRHHHGTHAGYYHNHVPMTKHGVPFDTPEVQKARALHLAAHAAAKQRSEHHHLEEQLGEGHHEAVEELRYYHHEQPEYYGQQAEAEAEAEDEEGRFYQLQHLEDAQGEGAHREY